jgi:peptidoglycan/xylan/chitin deacetylase (PgdA/CDA1 family)
MTSPDGRTIALTFDAEHPSRPLWGADAASTILDVLAAHDVRATFFVQGRWATANPDLARRIVADGHLLGNHSHFPARMTCLNNDGIDFDVTNSADALERITGARPEPWFRCPFGIGHDDPRVRGELDRLGYTDVHWDVSSDDWEARDASDVRRNILDGLAADPDATVLLMHSWPQATADALPGIVETLLEDGARFVTLDQLDRLP